MYIPAYYKNEDPQAIRSFIKEHEFATLVNQVEGKLWATHIPLQLTTDENNKEFLLGHVARANPQWRSFETQPEVMAIFQGPHTYVSSSWYDYEEVPTWNYMAVHVYGNVKFLKDEELYMCLKKLVDTYEKKSDRPVKIEEMSSSYIRSQMRGIKGFAIDITDVQAQFKLSQSQSESNRSSVIQHLEKIDDTRVHKIASEMKKNIKKS